VRANWEGIARPGDVLLIVGDLSWAMTIEEAQGDIEWIAALPGRKVVLRGNHDFWWDGIGRVRAALGPTVTALQNDHVVIDRVAIVGTRGWQCPGSMGSADAMVAPSEGSKAGTAVYTEHDAAIYRKEIERLKLAFDSLKRSGAAFDRLVVALHYPPMNPEHEPSGFTELIDAHGADVCVHGHLHGEAAIATAFEGRRGKTVYHCVSADAVRQMPRLLLEHPPATEATP
jgi:predicted phosphohydrolase